MATASETPQPTINEDVLSAAGSLGLNATGSCERELREAIAAEQARRWYSENRETVEKYNAWVEKNGVLLADLQVFKLDEA